MASGVKVTDEVIAVFNDMKVRKAQANEDEKSSFSSCKVTPITQPLSLFLVSSPLVSACFFALVNY